MTKTITKSALSARSYHLDEATATDNRIPQHLKPEKSSNDSTFIQALKDVYNPQSIKDISKNEKFVANVKTIYNLPGETPVRSADGSQTQSGTPSSGASAPTGTNYIPSISVPNSP